MSELSPGQHAEATAAGPGSGGQVVVVTGASAGIGRATAREFGSRGARVALLARGSKGLEGAAREVREAGGTALVIPVDVAEYDQLDAAATQVEQEFGPIDVWGQRGIHGGLRPVPPSQCG